MFVPHQRRRSQLVCSSWRAVAQGYPSPKDERCYHRFQKQQHSTMLSQVMAMTSLWKARKTEINQKELMHPDTLIHMKKSFWINILLSKYFDISNFNLACFCANILCFFSILFFNLWLFACFVFIFIYSWLLYWFILTNLTYTFVFYSINQTVPCPPVLVRRVWDNPLCLQSNLKNYRTKC